MIKRLDIFIIRILPLVLFSVLGINLICCWCGTDISIMYELHGNSVIYATALLLISNSNKKYHCVWNRIMYGCLIAIPVFNFIDTAFCLCKNGITYLIVVTAFFVTAMVLSSIMGIRHFIKASNRRRCDNGE